MKIHSSKSGFTLIEVVTVVTLISLLASAVFATFYKVRSNMRDTRRVAIVTQIQDSLETYYRDEGAYPIDEDLKAGNIFKSNTIVYINEVPNNPSPMDDGDCAGTDFVYKQTNGGKSYNFTFCLGHQTADLPAGINIATPYGIISGN
jgi:prepilin-type N-terminal cleavage/methylation domain-containing protein